MGVRGKNHKHSGGQKCALNRYCQTKVPGDSEKDLSKIIGEIEPGFLKENKTGSDQLVC